MPVLSDLLAGAVERGHRGRRPHRAALRRAPRSSQLPAAVRADRALRARGDQPLRRPRPGLVLEQLPHRRAHRHPLRRPDPLGDRPGRGRRRLGARRPAGRGRPPSSTSPAGRPTTPTSCSRSSTSGPGRRSTAPLPDRRLAAAAHRMGRAVARPERLPQRRRHRSAHPGVSAECARWLAEEAPVIGLGVETVGTDAGAAHSFDPPFPCHSVPAGRRQVRADPAAEPRAAAADRCACWSPPRCRSSAAPAARPGCSHSSSDDDAVRGSRGRRPGAGRRAVSTRSSAWWARGNFHVTNAMVAAGRGSWPPGTRAARPRWPTPTRG